MFHTYYQLATIQQKPSFVKTGSKGEMRIKNKKIAIIRQYLLHFKFKPQKASHDLTTSDITL